MSNGIKIQYLNGNELGLVAKSKRVIRAGQQYNQYFPKPEKSDPIVNKDGSVNDTVDYCEKIVRSTLNDTKRLAPLLRGNSIEETCRNIFAFIYDHIQYEEDKPGVEQVRRPARTWADRKGDCDCMSIFASSILTNLNIPHSFRIVKMYKRNYFQHIYVIVPRQKTADLSLRFNYIVIDPVLDKFNQEAPEINFKKDYKMENNLAGIPIQYLNGTNGIAGLGNEFEGLEGFNGTEGELHNEWHKRMKHHLINTHNAIVKNPSSVSHIYQPQALAGAYKELIGIWDSEAAREGKLDSLSSREESFLQPHLQGLGDIIGGPDDNLFGLINADLNGDLGKAKKATTKKAVARKAAKAASKPVKKRGPFTKIKQASKKIKANVKKAGAKAGAGIKHAAKKVGHAVVKGSATPLRGGILLAFKTNFGKIASRIYWGLFSKEEAMQHGILADYWQAANKSWNHTRDVFVNKLKGDEKVLRKSIITGRAAKIAKRGTHGLGSTNGELFTNGLGVVTEAAIVAASSVLVPLLAFTNSAFKGKKKTASSAPDNGNADQNDTGDNEPVSQTEADHAEDNYNNEVVETPPAQEPEADGSVQEDSAPVENSGDQEQSTEGLGSLGKKIKSKKGTIVHKRILSAKKVRSATKKVGKKVTANKTVTKLSKNAKIQKHINDALALKKLPADQLISKLKAHPKLKYLTHAQVVAAANNIKNKSTTQIQNEAVAIVEKQAPESEAPSSAGENEKPIVVNNPSKTFAENAQEGADNAKENAEADPSSENKKKIAKNAQEIADDAKDNEGGMSTTGKVVTTLLVGTALFFGGKALLGKKKNKPALNGLDGNNRVKHHAKKMLVEEGKKIQKKLAKQGERLTHGYKVEDKKKVTSVNIK